MWKFAKPLMLGLMALSVHAATAAAQQGAWAPHVGLQIVRAYTSDYGPDAEEFNTVASVRMDGIVIDYSDTRGITLTRQILASDRWNGRQYALGFARGMPNVIPGSTTLGVSTEVLQDLRDSGSASLALLYDTSLTPMPGELTLVARNVPTEVIVENEVVSVAALRATGRFGSGSRSAVGEFLFLDDQNAPILIEYAIKFSHEQNPRTVRLVRVTAGASQRAAMEHTLRTLERLQLYGIHFDFDSDVVRHESRGLIADLATVLDNNPDWTILIEGHTDSIGADDYNLDLSKRRAIAVATMLVRDFGIEPDRLEGAGFGEQRPIASNADYQGRARNRRVEIVRTDR